MIEYILSDAQEKKIKKFNKKHYKRCNSNTRLILTETGIGLGVEVQCANCNKIKNISDYDTW